MITSDALVLILSGAGDGGLRFWTKLLDAFKEEGFNATVVTGNPAVHAEIQSVNRSSVNMYALARSVNIQNLNELCKKLEQRYDLTSFREFCFPQSCYEGMEPESLIKEAAQYFVAFEEFFKHNRILFCVSNPGGEISCLSAAIVAQSLGVCTVFIGSILGHFRPLTFLHGNHKHRLEGVQMISYGEMSEGERSLIAEIIDGVCRSRGVLSYENSDILSKPRGGSLGVFVTLIREGAWDLAYRKLRWAIVRRVGAFARSVVAKLFYSRVSLEGAYAFFPLHLEYDSAITVCNPQFYRQEWIVEFVARTLPQGVRLVVKGHPGCPPLSIAALWRIRRIRNVVLLDPRENAHPLIEQARIVVTINSSVGAEALFHLKPVVVLGQWALRGLGLTFDVVDLAQLGVVLRKALSVNTIDRDRVQEVMFSLRRTMYPGSIYCSDPNYAELVRSIRMKAFTGLTSESATG